MKRSAPMKRTGFKSKAPPPRPVKTITYTPRPRECARSDGTARLTLGLPRPKFAYVRDTRLRDMCRAMACQHCGAAGPDAGVTWAHSNWAVHGKAKQRKASDVFVAALCTACHFELDQGHAWSAATKLLNWTRAHVKTVATALQLGLWPIDIPVPETDREPADA